MLGLIYEVKTSSILARRVYVEKDVARQAQHGLNIRLNLHISLFINFYTFFGNEVLLVYKINHINHLTPNGHFSGRTAPLTYRRCIFLFIQQIYILNILNMLHTLRFFLFKMPFIS
jgi:hypothetical protein